jgi:adenine deaminase
MEINGKIVDIESRRIYPAKISIVDGIILSIEECSDNDNLPYILPGFVDAHIHIESSMLIPSEFARMAVVHGTIATVSDPHEIANVMGMEGVEFMIDNGNRVPFKFYFGAPSCVPATVFETAGAEITVEDIDVLLRRNEVKYLAEMMNWPGVLEGDALVMSKIEIAKKYNKPVDGHAPGLVGADAVRYIDAGISTDHECFTLDEAENKLTHGMKILIREGSAAKNFEALEPLIDLYFAEMMFCSDDMHPDSLEIGHIDVLVKRALAKGHDLFKVLKMACINPVKHYKLDVGLLKEGDPADFIICDNLESFNILSTYIDGVIVSESGKSNIESQSIEGINNFTIKKISSTDLIQKNTSDTIPVIEVLDGELITKKSFFAPRVVEGVNCIDIEKDLLKLVVVNRYNQSKPAVAFIHNFNLKSGAIASSVAHDSHNIIAVGTNDESITRAINLIIENKGGLSAVDKQLDHILPLPIGGLMTDVDGYEVAKAYKELDELSKRMGSTLRSPFMSLSFMALLVIPSIKLSDKGLFDSDNFNIIV